MLGIMAGMNQKDCDAAIVFALIVVFGSDMCITGFARYDASHAVADVCNDRCTFLGRRHSCRHAEAVSRGPDCFANHRDSPVAVGRGEARLAQEACHN